VYLIRGEYLDYVQRMIHICLKQCFIKVCHASTDIHGRVNVNIAIERALFCVYVTRARPYIRSVQCSHS
jgi:hypothetical protein